NIPSGADPTIRLPEYMRVKPDAAYPVVEVKTETRQNEATFSTATLTIRLALQGDLVSLDVRRAGKTLIRHWTIRVGERRAELDLRPGERIYGFGDKRAAIDQR